MKKLIIVSLLILGLVVVGGNIMETHTAKVVEPSMSTKAVKDPGGGGV